MKKITFLILFLIFTFSMLLAIYHFGIERGIFKESFFCSLDNDSQIISKKELLKELKKNVISCKDVTFTIFGLSLATLNIFLSAILSVVFFRLFSNYGSNSTSQYK